MQLKENKQLLELKYKLKTDLENLIHKNIMEEIEKGKNIKREERRGL